MKNETPAKPIENQSKPIEIVQEAVNEKDTKEKNETVSLVSKNKDDKGVKTNYGTTVYPGGSGISLPTFTDTERGCFAGLLALSILSNSNNNSNACDPNCLPPSDCNPGCEGGCGPGDCNCDANCDVGGCDVGGCSIS